MRLAAAAEGQKILGVSNSRWHRLVQEPGFPTPLDVLACGAIYSAQDIEDFRDQRAAARVQKARQRVPAQQGRERRMTIPALPADLVLP